MTADAAVILLRACEAEARVIERRNSNGWPAEYSDDVATGFRTLARIAAVLAAEVGKLHTQIGADDE